MVLYTSYPLRQKQVGCKFQAILGYVMKVYLKKQKDIKSMPMEYRKCMFLKFQNKNPFLKVIIIIRLKEYHKGICISDTFKIIYDDSLNILCSGREFKYK